MIFASLDLFQVYDMELLVNAATIRGVRVGLMLEALVRLESLALLLGFRLRIAWATFKRGIREA